ncbi:UDP-glucose/GDP-mannose dehydrogenase family protein [uncultured Nitratireductor sp.]|uniref:UDP-glucose dehydrogenase family protein n=1 Tax=uncultured Nitratireductor sp. TaxID=520953 RepID=UPI0025F21554|nr:UDP-glucose/GDP-mannose dehydrogenase family protein [uncultured Nitratireductor sp.]
MRVTVFGTGYVGLVHATVLAEAGNEVVCVDIDEEKIARLRQGQVSIYEPGLERLVGENQRAERLSFTTSAREGVEHGRILFIAVGTPPEEDGSADIRHVLSVARTIGQHMEGPKLIVVKSTVPVGTADKVREIIATGLRERSSETGFAVASNPEFLKEGSAIADSMKPDRIVLGIEEGDIETETLLRELYGPFNRNHEKIIVMDVKSSELTKYAANCMLATKISFMNEVSGLAEQLGADIEKVRQGIGSDPRIGYHFIYPGAGYGGSCFPKDVRALIRMADPEIFDPVLLRSVEERNEKQKNVMFKKIMSHFNGDINGMTFAIWGLSFKPNTDDMREAPSRTVMEALWSAGARVRAYDPKAMNECRRIYSDRPDLYLAASQEDALKGADALVVMTEWRVFQSPNFELMASELSAKVVFDGRNIFSPSGARRNKITLHSIGRPAPV